VIVSKPIARLIPLLLASSEALPKQAEVAQHLQDVAAASDRGYYLPDEDERLREVFARYLAVRVSLLDCVHELSGEAHLLKKEAMLPTFSVAYLAALMLVRAADFVVTLADQNPVVRRKLDEPEPRFGLGAKAFTEIYRNLTSPRRRWAFQQATQYYHSQRLAIHALAASNPLLAPVVDLLQREEAFLASWEANYLSKRFGYRLFALLRRQRSSYRKTMFQLFKFSGTLIADLKQPGIKANGAGKRVTPEIRARLEAFLQPGDVLVTRHDDAMSNLFLPGFWPHAVFCLGNPDKRAAIGLGGDECVDETARFVEAKKDGVRIRPPEDTLAIDAFTVLRPKLEPEHLAEVVQRALSHAGKLYDFVFDFSAADSLACTELVYRSYHGIGDVCFELQSHAGRFCLSAEDLMNQAVASGRFEPVLVYGVGGDDWLEGEAAKSMLRASFKATF
jgi:hypothetical protein